MEAGATPAHSARSSRVSKPFADRVQRGRAHAVVGGDAAHVDVVDVVPPQPVGQRRAVGGAALEAGVGRRVLALEEHRVERLRVEVGVERLAVGADHAVRRPGVVEVGGVAEVVAGVDVVVAGGDGGGVVRRLGVLVVQWCSSSPIGTRPRRRR